MPYVCMYVCNVCMYVVWKIVKREKKKVQVSKVFASVPPPSRDQRQSPLSPMGLVLSLPTYLFIISYLANIHNQFEIDWSKLKDIKGKSLVLAQTWSWHGVLSRLTFNKTRLCSARGSGSFTGIWSHLHGQCGVMTLWPPKECQAVLVEVKTSNHLKPHA